MSPPSLLSLTALIHNPRMPLALQTMQVSPPMSNSITPTSSTIVHAKPNKTLGMACHHTVCLLGHANCQPVRSVHQADQWAISQPVNQSVNQSVYQQVQPVHKHSKYNKPMTQHPPPPHPLPLHAPPKQQPQCLPNRQASTLS